MMLTHKRLLEVLDYNPDTGIFVWKVAPNKSVAAGDVAGFPNVRGALSIGIDRKTYQANRLAWFYVHGERPKGRLSPRNQIKTDNRISNIRMASVKDIDHKTLLEELDYNRETGAFTYKRAYPAAGVRVGSEAGFESEGYIVVSLLGQYYAAHRLAWFYETGSWPKAQIDHKNTVKTDNRFENLRDATHSQNRMNVGKTAANTSGWKGVNWHKGAGKWAARIGVGRKRLFLGYFDDVREAAEAYIFAALEHHGDYARVE